MSSGGEWEVIEGETPVDPSFLLNREIRNRSDLALAEAENIRKTVMKYLASRPSAIVAPFDYEWFLKLHEEMFGEVWEWAGKIRNGDLNLGLPHYQVREALSALVGDLACWADSDLLLLEQAVQLHHRTVQIHPFPNGNGRWARLLSNIWLKRHAADVVEWPADEMSRVSAVREQYLEALKAADLGRMEPLIQLHQRFC